MANAKDSYLSLTAGNIAGLEENLEEFVTALAEAEGDEDDLETLRSVVTETLKFLAVQRKLDSYLHDNVARPDTDTVNEAMEVAEQLGITATFGVRVVSVPTEVAYRDALDIIYSGE